MSLFGRKEKEEIKSYEMRLAARKVEIEKMIEDMDILKDRIKELDLEKIEANKKIAEKDEAIRVLEQKMKTPYDNQYKKITLAYDVLTAEKKESESKLKEVIEVNRNLSSKNIELEALRNKSDQENKILRDEVKELRNRVEGAQLENKAKLEVLQRENTELRKKAENAGNVVGNPIAQVTSLDDKSIKYKILIKDLYQARKFDDFRRICEKFELTYVTELKGFDFESLSEENLSSVKILNAKKEYEKFTEKDLDLSMIEYLLKGHLVSKIFFRFRSFVNYLNDLNITYMSEMDKVNFDILEEKEFTPFQIEKFKKTLDEYNELRRK